MNYAFTKACLDAFAFGTLDASGFAEKLNELLMRNTDTVNGMMLNLLDSHDTHRFLTQVGGDIQKLGCALAVLYLFVGAPCIYYGTEIGMEGGYDPDCRRTMDWARAEERPPLWRLVQQLAACKRGKRRSARDEGKNMGGGRSLLSGARRNEQTAAHRQFRGRAAADR